MFKYGPGFRLHHSKLLAAFLNQFSEKRNIGTYRARRTGRPPGKAYPESKVIDLYRLDDIGQTEPEHFRIEVEFGLQDSLDILRLAKPMLLAVE